MGICLLFGDSVLPYLQLLTCLFFKYFLQLLQNKVVFLYQDIVQACCDGCQHLGEFG